MQDELVLITSPTHALAAKGRVDIKDLEPLMVMDVSEPSLWHRKIADALLQVKAPLHVTVENAPIEMIKKMVAVGVAFFPLMSVREEKENRELAVIEVDGFHLERSVWLVRRRAVQSPAAKAFTQTVVSFGEKLRGRAPADMPKSQEPPRPAFLKREKET